MKRNIPSDRRRRPASCSGSAADAVGVPPWACASAAARRHAVTRSVRDDVLDRQAGLLAQALDQVAAQPAAALARERRDDDLVDALVVRRLPSPRCTGRGARPGRARRSPRRAARVSARRRRGRPRRAAPRRSAARRSGSSRRPRRRARGSGRAAPPRRRSRSRSRARSSRPSARRLDDDVLDRDRPRSRSMSLDDVAAQPAGALARCVETMISSAAARAARARPWRPGPGRSRRRSPARRARPRGAASSVFSSRRPAEARRVSS